MGQDDKSERHNDYQEIQDQHEKGQEGQGAEEQGEQAHDSGKATQREHLQPGLACGFPRRLVPLPWRMRKAT